MGLLLPDWRLWPMYHCRVGARPDIPSSGILDNVFLERHWPGGRRGISNSAHPSAEWPLASRRLLVSGRNAATTIRVSFRAARCHLRCPGKRLLTAPHRDLAWASRLGHLEFGSCIALAQAGFVVAAVSHDELGPNWLLKTASRTKELHNLIEYALTAWPGHAHLDPERVGAFGFSFGDRACRHGRHPRSGSDRASLQTVSSPPERPSRVWRRRATYPQR